MNKLNLQTNQYHTSLDGLRGFATILVIVYHYLSFFPFFNFGWIGIELFFALSGFLISARILPFINQKKTISIFYWNRFLRIVPLYFLFLIIFFFFWFFFSSAQTQETGVFYKKHYWQFFLFIQNWIYILDFSQSVNHLQHLWSLAVEEQIYIVYPLFVLLFLNLKYNFFKIVLLLILIIMISRIFYFYNTKDFLDYKVIYWNTFLRADSFLCGVTTYLAFTNYKKILNYWMPIAGIISIIILITGILISQSFDKSLPFFSTIGRTVLAMSFCYLIWICVKYPNKLISRFFSLKFLTFTGKISYGLFIFHWPIFLTGFIFISSVENTLGIIPLPDNLLLMNAALSTLITTVLSYLSFRFYESFFLRWKKKYNSE